MTFQPIVPFTGYNGLKFIERTYEKQIETFNQSSSISRATEYFKENISKINTAEELVANRRLLEVALGAFGLEADIDNKFFIKKILEDGTTNQDALANRLSDKRYREFSQAFGFGDSSIPSTKLPNFVDETIQKFEKKSFQIAVGEIDNDLRLALNLSDALDTIVAESKNNNARWFSVMGNPPVRKIFEAALGLPSTIGTIDLDLQLRTFKSSSETFFGTSDLGELSERELKDNINKLFLLKSSLQQNNSISSASTALALLSQIS